MITLTDAEWRYQHGVGPAPSGFQVSPPAPRISGYTSDQITDGITVALAARDFPAVVALLKLLALKDPDRAQTLYDVMKLAVSDDAV